MTQTLDQLLNRFSMYRLLSVTLSAMWGFTVLLSALGILQHSVIAVIASGITLGIAAYLSNVLFGRLFGVSAHNESSYISALILFFVFTPTMVVGELAALALVAVIAMASKYILTIRGRHIFNPAAVAAVIIGVTGVTFASWWVATPALLPITVLFAFLILYKTRRLTVGYVFLATSMPLITLTYILNGQTITEALSALPSWPLLFFVGFMLSEPLTLPPRRWQQYATAGIVAVFFAIPLHIGILSGSPALALIIGNAFAFIFTQQRHLKLTFIKRTKITSSVYEYSFKPMQPTTFKAGQYIEITIPHAGKDGRGIRRIFSIIGTPDESIIRFGIRMYDRPSSFKQALGALKKGSVIDATGIYGDFVLPMDTNIPLLYVAGGIGITPFISQLNEIKRHNQTRDITLIYAVTNIDDIAYIDELRASGIRTIIVTQTNDHMPVSSWEHLNQPRLTAKDVAKYIPDIAQRHAYISGPPAMVNTTKAILKKCGAKHIKNDYFTGY